MLPSIARWLLKLGGWTVVGSQPSVPQAVIIAAPHTSNWDGIWALTCKVALELKNVRFFGKHTLFWFPLSTLLRGMGGIPLDRSNATSAVHQAVELFRSGEPLLFGLAPEGTRKKHPHWKSGFYRIALEAGVPVIPAFLDFGKRRIGLGEPISMTGDEAVDLEAIRQQYADVVGRHPENESPIRFADKAPS